MPTPVVVEKQLATPPEHAFQAFLSPERLAEWWWSHIPDTRYEVDGRVGGTYQFRSDSAGIGARGEYLELEEPHLIVITWNWMNNGRSEVEESVRIDLTANEGGTLIKVTHLVDDVVEEGFDSMRDGWTDVLDRLAAV